LKGPPQENFRGQKHAKFGLTLKFDGEYLRNGWRYSISVKYLIYRNSSGVRRKKSVNFGPPIAEILMWNHTHPNRLFRKTIFWPLSGAAPQIFTRAREWPSLTSTPPTGDRDPLYNICRGVQNWLNFGRRENRPMQFWQVTCRYLGMINCVQVFFGGDTALLKFGRAKNVQNLAWFRKTFDFERKCLLKGWRYQQAVNGFNKNYISGVEQKNVWTLVH